MPSWSEILSEINSSVNIYDQTRRKYITELSEYTSRNTIIYYSGFLQKANLSQFGADFSINDSDKTGFMNALHKLDKKAGLDLVLHTPGGQIAATESLVYYLKKIFGNDIRAIVPQIAMSAGTMIACSCKEIVMGHESNLGPIDPQFGFTPAHGIIEEFNKAKEDVSSNPNLAYIWREILQKYNPTLIGECEKAIKWSETIVCEWLENNMFSSNEDAKKLAKVIVDELGSHSNTLSHSRHYHSDYLTRLGMKIIQLESDPKLQDLVLSVHHSAIITLTQTQCFKLIENNLGKSFIQAFDNNQRN